MEQQILCENKSFNLYNVYLPSESNHVMSTNGNVCHLLIIILITVPLAPTAGALFTPNTTLLHILFLFKNVALIILNQKIIKKTFVSKYMH